MSSETLLSRIESVYHRLWRERSNEISQYTAQANSDQTLFALIVSHVLNSEVIVKYDEFGRSIVTPDGATWDEVRNYASEQYGYTVCERCDSDICEHVA
jgi:hypothetical protein